MYRTVSSFLQTGGGPNIVNSSFLPPDFHSLVKDVKEPPLRISTKPAVLLQGLIPLLVSLGDLQALAFFRIIENLAVDPLRRASYIDRCIQGIFPSKRNVGPIHFCPVAILTSRLKAIVPLNDKVRDDAIEYGSENLRYFPFPIVRQVTVQPCAQAPIMVTSPAASLS